MGSPFLYEPDSEIERTFRLRRKKQKIEEQIHEARGTLTNMVGGEGDQRRIPWDFVTPGSKELPQASLDLTLIQTILSSSQLSFP